MDIIMRPAPFVIVSTGHGTMITNCNDHSTFTNGEKYGVGHQLFTTSYFDPEESNFIVSLLNARRNFFGPGVVVVDGGANMGVRTIDWAKVMTGWGKVIAIEAQERVYYALAGNIAINNCFNASAIHAALGSTVGMLSIPVPDYCQPGSFGSLELKQRQSTEFIGQPISYKKENCQEIHMISIDSLNLQRLDLFKLDVEGMELEVLDGAVQTIIKHKPQMFIEIIKTNQNRLIQMLTNLGYNFKIIGINILATHKDDPSVRENA
jgi:FkbM family methyltransferase